MILTLYAYINFFFWLFLALYLLINTRRVRFLTRQKLKEDFQYPSVSIIVAVRNEERALASALETLCNVDYPDFELIVVNDRSTDATAEILSSFQKKYANLKIITITTLPEGWLGKNHALHEGYTHAQKDWLLFTDADIHFNKKSLRKAFQYAGENQLDHLTLLPQLHYSSVWLKAIIVTFQVMLEIKLRPWAVRNKRSKASIGVGAFNLVKKNVYEKIGTHKLISLRPDDDLQLGAKIKQNGFASDVCYANGELEIEWYANVKELIEGLQKNSFSAFNYQAVISVGAVFSLLLFWTLPVPILILFGYGSLKIIGLGVLIIQVILLSCKPAIKAKWYEALLMPWASLVMAYIIAKATFNTLRNKGIYWRDTFYSLRELKKQR